MQISLLRKKWIVYWGIILYRILLDVNYAEIIAPIYAYSGFVNLSTDYTCAISYIVLLLSMHFIIKQYSSERLLLSNVVVLLYLVCFVPGTSLMAYIPMNIHFWVLFLVYWFLFLYLALFIRPVKIPVLSNRGRNILLYLILGGIITTVLYVSWKYAGFRIHFSLRDVYDLREEERSWNLPLIFGYLLPTASTILPVFLVYFLVKKRLWLVLLLSVAILLNFSIGGHKSVIFKLLFCFLGYWFYSREKVSLYAWFLAFLSFISFLEWKICQSFTICTLLIRRALFLPAYLNYHYYDYFSTHEQDVFRQSFLRHLGIQSPYDIPIPRLIGEVYYNSSDTNANNGLFSDAYLNMGTVGVLLFPFLLIMVINIIDSVAKGIDDKLLILPIVVIVVVFSAGTLMSGLLTGGVGVLTLILFLFPKNKLGVRNV